MKKDLWRSYVKEQKVYVLSHTYGKVQDKV